MKAFLFALTVLFLPNWAAAQPPPSPLRGDWDGKLQLGDQNLRITLHVAEIVTLDSPDQNGFGLPGSITMDGAIARATFPDIDATIQGPISPDGQTLNAELSQGGFQFH